MGYVRVFSFFFFLQEAFWFIISMDVPKGIQHINLETYPCILQLHIKKNCRRYIFFCPSFRNNMILFFFFKFSCKGSCFTSSLSPLATPFSGLLYQRPDIELACGPVSMLLWLNYGKPFEQIGCESNGSECAISCQVAAVMQPFTGAFLEHFHWGQEGPEQQGCKNKSVPKWKVCLERVQLWTGF